MNRLIRPATTLSGLKSFAKSDPRTPEVVVGTGAESVYLYFDPMERAMAETLDWPHWRCKLGSTKRDVPSRILEQETHSAFAYAPVWALWIRTPYAGWVERQLQGQLTPVEDALGTEWYWTTPTEVLERYRGLPEPPVKPFKQRVPRQDLLTQDMVRQVLGMTDPKYAQVQLLVEFIWHTGSELHTALRTIGADLQRVEDGYVIPGRGRLRLLPEEFVQLNLGQPDQPSKRHERIFNLHPRTAQRLIKELGEEAMVDGLTAARIRRSALGIV